MMANEKFAVLVLAFVALWVGSVLLVGPVFDWWRRSGPK